MKSTNQNNYAFVDSQNVNLAIRSLGWKLDFARFRVHLKEKYKDGTTKGNCDAELVLRAMIEYPNYEKAVIVTGDGDFYCLIQYLIEKDKFERVIIPNFFKYPALLKRFGRKQLDFMNELRNKLEYKKRTP